MEVLSQPRLSVRVYDFLLSNGVACLRDVYGGLGEKRSRVDHCLRRLWKKNLVLRTREPTYQFEVRHKSRLGLIGNTRAINYYVINNGNEVGSEFVRYEDRKKDGKSCMHAFLAHLRLPPNTCEGMEGSML